LNTQYAKFLCTLGSNGAPVLSEYNRLVKSAALVGVAFTIALVLMGCNRGLESKEAVRQAILDHLSQRGTLNLSSMQVDVVSVAFRENEADVAVSFRPKGAGGSPGMTMNYTLQRQGNRWTVKGRSDGGASPHGAGGQMPEGMPSGHPSIGGGQPPETKK
jgi:hypothetical protein